MQKLDHISAFQMLCKSTGRWGMYVSFGYFDLFDELLKAAPWVDLDDHQMLADGSGIILFDSEAEMEQCFYQTVGDDGPTDTNPYNGPARVYALTCDPNGQTLNENT